MWPETLSYCQFRASTWRESPECHAAPTETGWRGEHRMGQVERTLSWLAEENRRGSWKTAGTSGSWRWAGPQAASSWGAQGILAASWGSPHWLSPRSPWKSQGTVFCFERPPQKYSLKFIQNLLYSYFFNFTYQLVFPPPFLLFPPSTYFLPLRHSVREREFIYKAWHIQLRYTLFSSHKVKFSGHKL